MKNKIEIEKTIKKIMEKANQLLAAHPWGAGLLVSGIDFAWVKALAEAPETPAFFLTFSLIYFLVGTGVAALSPTTRPGLRRKAKGHKKAKLWGSATLTVVLIAGQTWLFSQISLTIGVIAGGGASFLVLGAIQAFRNKEFRLLPSLALSGGALFFFADGWEVLLASPTVGVGFVIAAALAALAVKIQETLESEGVSPVEQVIWTSPRVALLGLGGSIGWLVCGGSTSISGAWLPAIYSAGFLGLFEILAVYANSGGSFAKFSSGLAPLGEMAEEALFLGGAIPPLKWWQAAIFCLGAFLLGRAEAELEKAKAEAEAAAKAKAEAEAAAKEAALIARRRKKLMAKAGLVTLAAASAGLAILQNFIF